MNIGDRAPEILGKDEEGRDIRLSDYRGRKLVLYFYPKDKTTVSTSRPTVSTSRPKVSTIRPKVSTIRPMGTIRTTFVINEEGIIELRPERLRPLLLSKTQQKRAAEERQQSIDFPN